MKHTWEQYKLAAVLGVKPAELQSRLDFFEGLMKRHESISHHDIMTCNGGWKPDGAEDEEFKGWFAIKPTKTPTSKKVSLVRSEVKHCLKLWLSNLGFYEMSLACLQMSKDLSDSSMNAADWYDATLKMSLGANPSSSERQGQHRWKRVTWEKAKKDFDIFLNRLKRSVAQYAHCDAKHV